MHGILSMGLEIMADQKQLYKDRKEMGYKPFTQMGIHIGCRVDLTHVNDKSRSEGVTDYSEVIPLIESLPTV